MLETTLSAIGHIVYVLLLLIGLLLVPLGLPGTWLMVVVAFVYSMLTDFQTGQNDIWVLVVIVALAILAELFEFGIGVIGSKKLKVSNKAIISSLIGGFIGAILGFPIILIGSLIGLLIGVFVGAFIYEIFEQKNFIKALTTSMACFFSRVTAMFVKTAIAFAIVVYLLMKTF